MVSPSCRVSAPNANRRCRKLPSHLETSVGPPETSVGYWKLPRADKRTVAKISIHSKRKTWEKELHERARPVRLLAAYSRMPVWPTHGL